MVLSAPAVASAAAAWVTGDGGGIGFGSMSHSSGNCGRTKAGFFWSVINGGVGAGKGAAKAMGSKSSSEKYFLSEIRLGVTAAAQWN